MNSQFLDTSHHLEASYLRPTRLEHPRGLTDHLRPTPLIFSPTEGQLLQTGEIVIKGYVLAGICEEIEQVELSVDGGKSWTQTELSPNPQPGEWRLWRKKVSLALGHYMLAVRITENMPTGHRVRFEVGA